MTNLLLPFSFTFAHCRNPPDFNHPINFPTLQIPNVYLTAWRGRIHQVIWDSGSISSTYFKFAVAFHSTPYEGENGSNVLVECGQCLILTFSGWWINGIAWTILRVDLPLANQYAQRCPTHRRVNAMDKSLPFSHSLPLFSALIFIYLFSFAIHHYPLAGIPSRLSFPLLF